MSVPGAAMNRWLAALDERELIAGAQPSSASEPLAALTDKGRELLDRYFSATDGLQAGAHT